MQKLTLILVVFTSVCAFIGQSQTQTPPLSIGSLRIVLNFRLSIALSQIRGLPFEEASGRGPFRRTKWRFFDMTITNHTHPTSVVTQHPTNRNGYVWTLSQGSIVIEGRFTTKRRIIKRRGTFRMTVSGINVSVEGTRGANRAITINRFQCSTGRPSFKFKGARTWLLKLFKRVIGRKVKSSVQAKVCNKIRTDVLNRITGK